MTPQTIVQIESFYPQLLEQVYRAMPGLQDQPFEQQIAQLLGTGFSGGHNVTPCLDPSRWTAHYIVLNSRPSQQRWAREHGLAADIGSSELLLAQLRHLKPQVLYLSDIPGFDFRLLDALSPRPFVVGWHATTVSPQIPWSAFDLVLSGIQGIRDEVLARGARAAADFMPAAPPYLHLGAQPPAHPGPVFSGSFYGAIHQERAQQFRRLSRAIGDGGLDIYTPQPFATGPDDRIRFHAAVYGTDVIRVYARHGMVLDSRGDFNLGDGQRARDSSNMRIFEATRAGSLLLTENSPNLPRYFEPGIEVETYTGFDELVDKIRHYTHPDHEAARRRIADAGLARVRRSHLLEHRAAWLEDLLGRHLGTHASSHAVQAAHEKPARRTAFLLPARSESLLFTLAQAEQLPLNDPDVSCHLLCLDAAAEDWLPKAAAAVGRLLGVTAEPAHAPGDDLRSVLRHARRLVQADPQVQRVVYLGGDLSADGMAMGPLTAAEIVMGRWQFGASLSHAVEALGTWSPACLSVTRAVLESAWVADSLADPAASRLAPDAFVAAAQAAGCVVRPFDIATPWAGAAIAGGLRLVGPVSLVDQSRWEFRPYESAPGWTAYVQQVYMPLLQQCQRLIARLPDLASLGNQRLPVSSPMLADYLARHESLARGGYRLLSAEAYQGFAAETSGWDTPSVAAIQHASFRRLLDAFKAGQRRADLQALTRIFSRIARPGCSVLEEGCGSGYNSEVIRWAVGGELRYTGIDIAHAMIDLARDTYPGDKFRVMPSEQLAFEDGSFDVVLNGASLMHTVGYEQALREARRVARRHVVLHTVTVADVDQHVHFEKDAYGARVPEVCFSARGLDELLAAQGLLPVLMEDSIDYDLRASVGVPSRSVSLACLRLPEPPAQPHQYCTYFDSNYLPRGVLMIRSLLRHDPTAVVHVLCLDDVCAKALAALDLPLRILPLQTLLEADPAFARSRENRTLVEWYFTATSCLVHYLTQQHPEMQRLTYLDADLYFYASPEVMLDEARDASVHIVEHRFSPAWAQLTVYGRFNVGWITFTTGEEGCAVITDYRERCLEWCHDRLEGDRFGDQKYLDRWPERFPNCCVSQLQGANVAWWNLANAQPRRLGQRLFIGSELLLFFHFQEIKRDAEGRYATKREASEYGAYFDLVYAPYVAELTRTDVELAPLIEGFRMRDIRYQSW